MSSSTISTFRQPSRIEGRKAGRCCKGKCVEQKEYVGLRRIKFGPEMGYQKCTMCDCHFFKPDYGKCKCCGTRLRMKVRVRTVVTKEKAETFLQALS